MKLSWFAHGLRGPCRHLRSNARLQRQWKITGTLSVASSLIEQPLRRRYTLPPRRQFMRPVRACSRGRACACKKTSLVCTTHTERARPAEAWFGADAREQRNMSITSLVVLMMRPPLAQTSTHELMSPLCFLPTPHTRELLRPSLMEGSTALTQPKTTRRGPLPVPRFVATPHPPPPH